MRFLALLIFVIAGLPGCKKCGCIPPPSSMNWKVVSFYGGVGGGQQPLTEAQKNHILTIRSDGSFTCINTVTGATFDGGIIQSNFSSIYGEKIRLTFQPSIPMIESQYIILVEKSDTMLLLGDNVTDGYMTKFGPAQ